MQITCRQLHVQITECTQAIHALSDNPVTPSPLTPEQVHKLKKLAKDLITLETTFSQGIEKLPRTPGFEALHLEKVKLDASTTKLKTAINRLPQPFTSIERRYYRYP